MANPSSATQDGEDTGDTLGMMFENKEWLAQYAYDGDLQALADPHMAMEYFCQPDSNPFYDRSCNNQRIKQQTGVAADPEKMRKTMTGLEYTLGRSQGAKLNVIFKQHRISESEVNPLAVYYMIEGKVFQAPSLSSVLSSRFHVALSHIQKALQLAKSSTVYSATQGHTWMQEKDSSEKLGNYRVNPLASKRKGATQEVATHDHISQLISEVHTRFPIVRPTGKPSQFTNSKPFGAQAHEPQQGQFQNLKRKADSTSQSASSKIPRTMP
eukprot:m.136156 g.136156  ORF g.136156 m.136156 type:complete len:269 (-) comp14724_c0_seq7:1991-2797(-)